MKNNYIVDDSNGGGLFCEKVREWGNKNGLQNASLLDVFKVLLEQAKEQWMAENKLSQDERIRDCPFCRSQARLERDPLFSENGRGYPGAYDFYVRCTNKYCGVTLPHGKYDSIYCSEDDAIEKAIKRWNARC